MQRNMLQRCKNVQVIFVAKSDPYQRDRGDKIGNKILPDSISWQFGSIFHQILFIDECSRKYFSSGFR